jgi:hypothetical protein
MKFELFEGLDHQYLNKYSEYLLERPSLPDLAMLTERSSFLPKS